MHRNNVCHGFLLFYLGHSMKSRRSQSIRIKGFFNRFLRRSQNAMTVNVNINISSKVVKAAKSDKLNKDLFVAGLPRARSARGTEPHTHRIWSTSFRLVVT